MSTKKPGSTRPKDAPFKGVSKRVTHSYIRFNCANVLVSAGSRRFHLSVVRPAVLRWHARSAAALWEHISLRVIAHPLVRAKKNWTVLRMCPPLREEDKYNRMLIALGLMEPRMKNPVTETHLPHPPTCYEWHWVHLRALCNPAHEQRFPSQARLLFYLFRKLYTGYPVTGPLWPSVD